MTRKPSVRFAVVDPVTGRHSGEFKVWTRKNDVYIATADAGGVYKVSLHPGVYRVAYTQEHWITGGPPNNAPGPGRNLRSYEPSLVVDGVAYAWRMVFQVEALLHSESLDADVERIQPELPDDVAQLDFWLCDAEVQAQPPHPVGHPLPLRDGRVVRIGYDVFQGHAAEGHVPGRREYVGSMFEFADREHSDGAPGLILRPVGLS